MESKSFPLSLGLLAAFLGGVPCHARAAELVSAAAVPAPPSPNGGSWIPAASDDGRWVVFATEADNLVAGDTNNLVDVVRLDRQTGAREVVSRTVAGPANGNAAFEPVDISNDGRYVLFASDASNLVPGDDNSRTDLFRKDMQTGEIRRIAWSSAYPEPPFGASLSGDGQKTVMSEPAVKWLPQATTAPLLIAIDWSSVSASVIATTHVPDASAPALSSDGSCILYRTDSPGIQRVSLRKLATGNEQWIDLASAAVPNGSTDAFAVSADCSVVGFQSMATNLLGGPAQPANQVYRRTLASGSLVRVSNANDDSAILQRMSPDGRYFLYARLPDNGTPSPVGYHEYRDIQAPVSLRADWLQGIPAHVNNAGSVLTLSREALANDLNGVFDVHVSEPAGAPVQLLVPPASIIPGLFPNGMATLSRGRDEIVGANLTAFTSLATNLLASGLETDTVADVYLRDRGSQSTTRLLAALSVQPDDDVFLQDVSPDGRFFVLGTSASNLIAGDSNNLPDVFLYDRVAASMVRVSLTPQGGQALRGSRDLEGRARVSNDGRYVVFNSFSPDIVPAGTRVQTMVHDLNSGATRPLLATTTGDIDFFDMAGGAAYALAFNYTLQAPGCGIIGVDVASGAIDCPLRRPDGNTINDLIGATVSSDARFVAYPDEQNPQPVVFVRDRLLNRVHSESLGITMPATSAVLLLSGNGRYLAVFESRDDGRAYLLVQDLILHAPVAPIFEIGGFEAEARIDYAGTSVSFQSRLAGGDAVRGISQVWRQELRGEGVFGGGWQGGFE